MKSFNSQLNPTLVSKSRQLERLTSILSAVLPPETNGHYHVAGMDNSTLTIITDSPVWTSRLRQLAPMIIETLSGKLGSKLQHIRIISRHGTITAPAQTENIVNRVLSEQSAQQVARAAEHIRDEDLKKALLNLSKRGNFAEKTD